MGLPTRRASLAAAALGQIGLKLDSAKGRVEFFKSSARRDGRRTQRSARGGIKSTLLHLERSKFAEHDSGHDGAHAAGGFQALGVKGAHAHKFRHTLATDMLAKGKTTADVAGILGISEAVVIRHYTRWSQARQERITSKPKP